MFMADRSRGDMIFSYWRISILAQLTYKKDFLVEIIVWFLYSTIPFLSLTLLLQKFVYLGRFSIYHIAVLYGLSQMSYDIARMFGRGFDNFADTIMSGDFDIYYIRPLSILFQILANDIFLRRIAGILQGAIILAWGLTKLQMLSSLFQIILIVFIGSLMYMGLFIFNSSLILLTIKENSFVSYLIDLSVQVGYYPIDLIKNPLKTILTFILPIGLCIYYPVCSVFDGNGYFYRMAFSGLTSLIVLFFSIVFFHLSKRKYISVNN